MKTLRDIGEVLLIAVVLTAVIILYCMFVGHLEAGGRAGG